MSSTDPMRDDSLILSETMRRISLRPYRLRQILNTKSSSLTKQITQPQMYNLPYGRLLRSLLATVDSSSPATTKTKSLNHSIQDAPSLTFLSKEEKELLLHQNSLRESRKSFVKKKLSLIPRLLQKLSKTISQISEER